MNPLILPMKYYEAYIMVTLKSWQGPLNCGLLLCHPNVLLNADAKLLFWHYKAYYSSNMGSPQITTAIGSRIAITT